MNCPTCNQLLSQKDTTGAHYPNGETFFICAPCKFHISLKKNKSIYFLTCPALNFRYVHYNNMLPEATHKKIIIFQKFRIRPEQLKQDIEKTIKNLIMMQNFQ